MAAGVRHWIVVTFVVAVLLLAFVGAVAYRTTAQLVEAKDRVTRSHDLVERLTYLRLLLDDAETSSRGYALTGRTEYLEPYGIASVQIDATLQILRHDLAESPDLLQGFEELPPLIHARLDVMRELIGARDKGGVDSAIAIASSGRGKDLMDKLRAKITGLQIKEQNLLLEEEAESRRSAHRAIWAVLLASGIGVAVLAIASTVIYRTVVQRERAEAELRGSQAMQRAILDGTNHAIMLLDADGVMRTVNATGISWLGYGLDELVGQSVCLLHEADELRVRADELSRNMSAEVLPGFQALSAKPFRGIAEEHNWTYRREDGSRMPVRVSMSALRDRSGAVTGYVVIASDLSERQAVERMKDELISVVSHELRTPLTSIKGALGLLASGMLQKSPERAGRMVQIASENADRLMRLVNDILDLERMQSGKLAFDKAFVDTAELMRQAVDSVHVVAESAGVSVEVTATSETIRADAGRIVQSFTNLLGNAIKFSPRGGIVNFTATVVDTNIIFRVADHGRGIPADKLETIFERFQQVDASDSRDKGGTGLGLAITRSIVEQHGGEVWAESDFGRGSDFFIRLPLAHSAGSTFKEHA